MGFEHEAEARRFWDAMRTTFEQFSLELHGEKTRLLEFGRYAIERRQHSGQGKPQTFNFLGMHSRVQNLPPAKYTVSLRSPSLPAGPKFR